MTYLEIINGLSEKISEELKTLRMEEYHPSLDADAMDDKIKHQKQTVENLVHVRTVVEMINAGYPGPK